MARAKVVVSAGVILYVNGRAYGRVKGFQWNSDTPVAPKYGLDSTEPFELAPTITKINGKISVYRTIGDGGAEGAAMATPYEDLPRAKYFTVQLIERASDTVVFEARECSVVRQSWSVPERGMVTGEVEFEALEWSNELRPLR